MNEYRVVYKLNNQAKVYEEFNYIFATSKENALAITFSKIIDEAMDRDTNKLLVSEYDFEVYDDKLKFFKDDELIEEYYDFDVSEIQKL